MASDAVKVAAVQMTSGLEVAGNLRRARELLELASSRGAKLAVLPENFALMARRERDKREIAEADGEGPIQSMLSAAARDFGLTVVGGTMPLKIPGEERVAPASLVYGPDGQRIGRYDKIHLFDVNVPDAAESHRESAGMAPGRSIGVFDTPAGRIGVAVCYDLRFPELFRRMSEQRADYFVVSAAFTVPTGQSHWDLLVRARAVENLCHLVVSAQVGQHPNGRATWGHSMVVDCWGGIVDVLPEGEGVAVGDVDLARQARVRSEFPALEHRVLGRIIQ
ncbi:MAG TPA: carbon-nitrogen hydrolase family protein [Steroidobacteraceae bacterium]|nr:carbon-nitrogen hydrolase family protein [Steroidobacteraceae bacterium]